MSDKITINVAHKLSRDVARSRIENGFEKVQQQIAGKSVSAAQDWQGDQMNFSAGVMGQSINGTLMLEEGNIRIEIELPWFLAKMSDAISTKVKQGTQLLLKDS